MPLPGPEVIGFGYVTSEWVDDDSEILLSDDSRLSSTSLIRTLIDPSSSEDEWLWVPKEKKTEDNVRYTVERDTLMRTMSFMRRNEIERAKEAGLAVNFEEVRTRDSQRLFTQHVVPTISEAPKALFYRKHPTVRNTGEKLLSFMDLDARDRISWPRNRSGRLISGTVGNMLSFRETCNIDKRTQHIKRFKERLEKEKAQQISSPEQETQEKDREEKVLEGHTVEEKAMIKEHLGDIPTLKETAFYPYGKMHISSVVEDLDTYQPSYDEFRTTLDDLNRYSVRDSRVDDDDNGMDDDGTDNGFYDGGEDGDDDLLHLSTSR